MSAVKALVRDTISRTARDGAILFMPSLRLDDSGHEDSTSVFVVAGYVAEAEAWDAFEDDWEKIARGKVLHMKDLCGVEGRGQFKNWGKKERDEFIHEMGRTIDRHLPQGVARAVYTKDYKEFLRPANDMFLKGTTIRQLAAVGWCLRLCLEWIGTEWPERPNGRKISVIFEEGTKWLGEAITYCRTLKQTKSWGRGFGSIATDSKANLISLQAGDFLAYHIFKFYGAGGRDILCDYPVESFRSSLKTCKVNYGYLARDDIPHMLNSFTISHFFKQWPL